MQFPSIGRAAALGALVCSLGITFAFRSQPSAAPDDADANAHQLVQRGREIFRVATFGDEDFWGGTLHLHEAIAGAANGGVGPGVSPATALAVGLKVDASALPPSLKQQLENGQVDLDDPAVTIALVRLNSVVGVRGVFDPSGAMTSMGITCALCHSTVDDSFAPGIGERRDGWPNRDLDVGSIIALAPDLSFFAGHLGVSEQTVKDVLHSWGPGKFDAALLLDGKAFQPNGTSAATLIPAAFGLGGVNLHTYTGWGSVSYWNAFVANLEMGGQGRFYDPRLRDAAKFPLAAAAGFDDVTAPVDKITPKLAALQFYQLALPIPKPLPGSFDPDAAERGDELFEGRAGCSRCHVEPLFTEPGHNLHRGSEFGIDDFQSKRSPTGAYRTTPLGGLFTRTKGGFFHDGRFATLLDVVNHYDSFFNLGLTPSEKSDLVEYLKSI